MKRPGTINGLPHVYRLVPGLGYLKTKAVKAKVRHRVVGPYIYTACPL